MEADMVRHIVVQAAADVWQDQLTCAVPIALSQGAPTSMDKAQW